MTKERAITREELNHGVGAIIRIIDVQGKNPSEALLDLEGRSFRLTNGNFIRFQRRNGGVTSQNESDPTYIKSIVTYLIRGMASPALKAVVTVTGLPPFDSLLSFYCKDVLPGYTVFSRDRFNTDHYRFFSNDSQRHEMPFRKELQNLSDKLSL